MAQDNAEWLQRDWLAPGMTLIEQGGRTGKLYVLRSGEVEVIRDGSFVLAIRTPGSIFGEMSVLLDIPHSATVKALTEVEVFVIANALAMLEANPGWLLQIARLLAQRVNTTTAMLAARDAEAAEAEAFVLPQTMIAHWSDPQV
ncbi:Cyclic nucleotide-binding domain-containing protein [Devosia enhydra]|uniref:Cyclic nucleotide-binding domain-containing protein n=1 Tax=Devosia enhydra TaxID=665118 RepID=A0A1K2HXS2_9HYPH|nr:cyclic nucleotide-binding domain-containing protein [Devosia enhydra]SFZ84190.1 Cyclic nucleotide-binding domain-containing protein [Devosia enhydra]